MEEDRGESTRYWCHQCNFEVNPILGIESVNCSLCHGGFVEEIDGSATTDHTHETSGSDPDLDPDRAISLWAPILLGMMNNNPRRRRRFRQLEFDSDDTEEDRHLLRRHRDSGESELDRELEAVMRRRRQSSATILQLLQGVRAGIISESETENNADMANRERERVILINPFNQTIIVQGGNSPETHPIGSLGDYFAGGPGLDRLLQHLAENDPNRYGTPPAKKEAVEAMPNVTIEENSNSNQVQCSVCLDDFEVGIKAKEMPCKHRFHDKCILPWLELHSSCPVCRFELPSDESKVDQEQRDGSRGGVERRFSVSLPWPFNGLFSSTSGSGSGSSPGP